MERPEPTAGDQAARAATATAFVLAPLLAELLTGSLPPSEFFHPVHLLLTVPLYGCGALLCHELATRRRGGWRAIVLYAVAFTIVAEGFGSGSLTSPDWVDIGPYAHYGRVFGANWLWALMVIAHHVMLGVVAPLLAAELWFPAARGRVWLDRPSLGLAGFGLAAVVIAAAVVRAEPVAPRALLWQAALIALLVWRARAPRPAVRPARPLPPWRVLVQTALVVVAGLLAALILPDAQVPATPVFFLGLMVLFGLAGRTARRIEGGWSPRHSAALLSGLILPLAVLCFWQEHDAARREDSSGMAWVGLAALYGLLLLRRRVGAGATSARPGRKLRRGGVTDSPAR